MKMKNNVLQLVQRIPSCEEANVKDVDEWKLEYDEMFTDQEIVKMVTPQEPGNNFEESDNETDKTTKQSLSHADTTVAFDRAL